MEIRSRTPLHILTSTIPLDALGEQERYLLGIATLRRPCPACDKPCHQVEACRGVYDFAAADQDFACPSCGVALEVTVPFLSSSPWFWSLLRAPGVLPTVG